MSKNSNFDAKEELCGVVEKITYSNETNGYTVAVLRSGKERVTVVGTFPFLSEGETLKLTGNFIVHPTYGSQFSATSFERTAPSNVAGILRYLSTGVIKGVGPSTATKIIEKFGADSLNIIQNHPEELSAIKGISLQKAYSISEEYSKQFGIRDVMLLLSPYEIGVERCAVIYRELGKDAVEKIKENPYLLCGGDMEISFAKAEIIASDFGISSDNELRLSAGIEYILLKNLMNGHTCLPRKKLVAVAMELLESDFHRIESVCDKMVERLVIVSKRIADEEFLALPDYYYAEEYIAARLSATKRNIKIADIIDDLEIDYVENKLGIKFEDLQRQAVKKAFDSGVLVLTGGPGTGKTTTLNAIIRLFEMRDMAIQLAAPTGRAAKRMTELTGREAKTIHRLLEAEWGAGGKQQFCRNERNPLECDVIIVDEASMIDTLLFENLLKALRLSCRIIIVGDANQLPSVSAGNVLNDILLSEKFSSIRLKKVFRQAMESTIIRNAHAIIENEEIDLSNKGKDFFFVHKNSSWEVCNTVLELCTERLSNAYGFDSFSDIQVLCPSRKMECGSLNLNNLLQSVLNPREDKSPQFSYKGVYMRKGDKVMQIKNNYDIMWERKNGEIGTGVFNGDVGIITDIDIRGGIVKVQYEDRVATYLSDNLSELELAYAVTVHKSQGSEFECVVIPLFDIPSKLKYRNLLYTAVTRAKKLLVLVGTEKNFYDMVENDRKTLRYTMLKEFINENFY